MKKKILIIGPGMEIGGVERSLLGLLDAIDYERYDVDLFLISHTGELMPLLNPKANLLPENKALALTDCSILSLLRKCHFLIAFVRLFAKVYADLMAKLKKTQSINMVLCKKIITKWVKPLDKEYDMVLSFFLPHYFAEQKVKAKLKIGWVHTDYSNENEAPDTKYLQSMWEKLDYIACVSEEVKTAFDKVYPALTDKTIVIENILSEEFVRSQAEAFDVSEEMPPWEGANILSVGRFCTQKNFDTIPAVCRLLQQKGIAVRWYLIGYGLDEALIRQKISEEGMGDIVIILGKKTNPYPYMKACDIYAQPSRYEGKAVTVREAQMLGKPVLITDYATAASQVENEVDGYICALSEDGIAEGIAHLISNDAFRLSLEENTRRRNYTNCSETDKLMNLRKIE